MFSPVVRSFARAGIQFGRNYGCAVTVQLGNALTLDGEVIIRLRFFCFRRFGRLNRRFEFVISDRRENTVFLLSFQNVLWMS